MERLPAIYKFFYVLAVVALLYDIVYWVIDADMLQLSSLMEIWQRQHPETLKQFQELVTSNAGKKAWLGLKKWMDLPSEAALLIPAAILQMVYYLWYSFSRGGGGSYPYHRG